MAAPPLTRRSSASRNRCAIILRQKISHRTALSPTVSSPRTRSWYFRGSDDQKRTVLLMLSGVAASVRSDDKKVASGAAEPRAVAYPGCRAPRCVQDQQRAVLILQNIGGLSPLFGAWSSAWRTLCVVGAGQRTGPWRSFKVDWAQADEGLTTPGQFYDAILIEWASSVPCPAADLPTGPRAPRGCKLVINVNRKRSKDFSTVCLHWPACLLV